MQQVLSRERVEARRQRGRELVDQGKVLPIIGQEGQFVVLNGQGAYLVTAQSCSCPDAHYRQVACKHMWAARFALGQADDPWAEFEPEGGDESQCYRCGEPAEAVQGGRPVCGWHILRC